MPDPQLVVYVRGGAHLCHVDGSVTPLPGAFLSGPTLAPRHFTVEPGSRFVTVAFRAHRLLDFFDLQAGDCPGALIPLDLLVPRAQAQALAENLRSAGASTALLSVVQRFLLERLLTRPLRSARLPMLPPVRAFTPVEDLARETGLGVRQFERHFRAAYGMPLRDFRRLLRFSRALAQMLTGPAGKGAIARIAQDSSYFDQSHFVRDFREFVGDTPGAFLSQQAQQEPRYELWRFSREELRLYTD